MFNDYISKLLIKILKNKRNQKIIKKLKLIIQNQLCMKLKTRRQFQKIKNLMLITLYFKIKKCKVKN